MASQGVTTPATQDVVRITSAGAAAARRTGRRVQAGDLVAFDAGVVADGYAARSGRTWPVGRDGSASAVERPVPPRRTRLWARPARRLPARRRRPPALLDAYARGRRAAAAACRSARGLGLGFDDPVIVRDLPADRGAGAARSRASSSSSPAASSTTPSGRSSRHEPVLITADGPEVLSSSPFWNRRARRSPRHDRRPSRPRSRLDPLREGPGDQDRHAHAEPARPAQRADHRHAAALRRPAAPGQHRRRREGPRDPRRGRRLRHRPGPPRVHGGGALRGRPAARGAGSRTPTSPTRPAATSATAPPPPSGSPTPAAAAGRSRSSRRSPSSRPRATCYGWHFYQAGDADLVISSDDALFGHAAFRYAGAAPRMWWWAHVDGPPQVPGDGLHRPALHGRRDGRAAAS